MKPKILALLAALFAVKQDIQDRLSKPLEALKPEALGDLPQPAVDLIRAADFGLASLKNANKEIDPQYAEVETILAAYVKEEADAAISAQVTAGALIRKEDHETLITAAAEKAKKEVEQQFQAAADKATAIKTKRDAITKDHGLHVAAAISDDDLAADDADTRITRVTKRSADLKEAGILAESTTEKFHASMLACANTAEGDTEFTARLEAFKATGFKASAQPPVTAPRTLPAGSSEGKKLIA